MTDFKNIYGTNIQVLNADPANPLLGQMWFNTTSDSLKGLAGTGGASGAWTTKAQLNTGRNSGAGTGNGTQLAALVFGGSNPDDPTPSGFSLVNTESWNGTSWTEVNDLNTGRAVLGGAGTQTTALAFGGYIALPTPSYRAETESWNGTSWTELNNLNTARSGLAGAGATNTAALAFGGDNNVDIFGNTESWNGTSWTELNDLNTARIYLAGSGTNTAALAFGGAGPYALTEIWNGTSWTEVNNLNTARDLLAGSGTQAASLATGGSTTVVVGNTESWNGTSWTELNDLNTARSTLKGAGTGTGGSAGALVFGGSGISSTSTESFGRAAIVTF